MKENSPIVRRRLPYPRARCRSAQVLVVDDYQDNAESMAMLLRLHGHEVVTALSGPSAVHAARARRPEVVFLDISMPGMDGYQVAKELRRMFGRRVLLIAVTAVGSEDQGHFEAAGFDGFFIKPADPDLVQRLVSEFGVSLDRGHVDDSCLPSPAASPPG